jgi:hypothetical protein
LRGNRGRRRRCPGDDPAGRRTGPLHGRR